MMREHLPDVPVLVDGLARHISEIYQREANLAIFGGQGPAGQQRASPSGSCARSTPVS